MNRRQFTAAALAAGLHAGAAPAIDIRGRQVLIRVRLLVVKEQGSRGFAIDLDRRFPSFPRGGGRPETGITLGIGGSTGHNDDAEIGLGLGFTFGGNRSGTGPTLDQLLVGAAPAGRIGLAGDRLIHAAGPETYRGVNTATIVNGGQTFVIGGMIDERQRGRSNNIPSFGRLPVIGETFRTRGEGNRRPEVILIIRPGLVDQVG